jgi:tRNA dimethylallyltransferase
MGTKRISAIKALCGRIVFIVGPTAIGKTTLAIRLARGLKGEIISADSMQIYKGMRILNQAPTGAEAKRARHHLIASLDPAKEYSLAQFIKDASSAIDSIIKRGRIPIIAGGSGLYVKGLIDGLFPSPKADLKFRREQAKFAAKYGSRKLHTRLARIDPASAEKIHPNDLRRIIRSLEAYYSTGKTMTELKGSTRGLKDRYGINIFGLTAPREEIYSRINNRVDRMFLSGAVGEVKKLKRRRLSKTAGMVLGFGEISGYLDGKYGLDEASEKLKMNTRRFAKRQLTWFGADKRIRWFDVSRMSEGEIVRGINRGLKA